MTQLFYAYVDAWIFIGQTCRLASGAASHLKQSGVWITTPIPSACGRTDIATDEWLVRCRESVSGFCSWPIQREVCASRVDLRPYIKSMEQY